MANGLDEGEANRVVVALDRASIDATKEGDPASEGKFRVLVARDDVAPALRAMQEEELPRARPQGVLDAVGKGALVPSQQAEHAQYVAGLAGDLEKTLEGVDGVLAARVHLSIPQADPLARDRATTRGSASVLLEHRGATPPMAADAVQRLVSGGVAGLTPADVNVVMISRPAPASPSATMAHVGPIAVARASVRSLQVALVALVGLVAILAAATLYLYTKLTRARRA